MIPTRRTRRKIAGAVLASVLLFCPAAHADDYRDARAELIAAHQQENHPAMLLAARRALAARPGYPGALYNLALTQTLNSDHRGSLQTLATLLEKGVDFGVFQQDEFVAVRELDEWAAYASKVKSLYEPLGIAEVAATYPDSQFVPEGIAISDDEQLYVGSIRTGQLVQLGANPQVLLARGTSWSVFGMRFHVDGSLWFASAAVPELANVGKERGQTGLFRLDTATGEISRAAILPQYAEDQVLGDLIIVDANTIYATDSLNGAIYRYYIDSNEYDVLVRRGKLGSPQGLVLSKDGSHLYVADYIGGLYRVDVQDGSIARMDVDERINDYGIDGLYRYGDELIAIQNGTRPHRVVALQLGENGFSVTGSRILAANLEQFDEPTLGAVRGDEFFFVANSHWNRFDRESNLPEGLSGPIILKLRLD